MTGPGNPIPLDALPAIPRDADGPVFSAPWEAQAFALAVDLHARGAFTWAEWTAALAREIASAGGHGGTGPGDAGPVGAGAQGAAPGGAGPRDADTAERYYEHWLAALEGLVTAKGLSSAADLAARRAAWKAAAEAAPHGEPIVLDAAARGRA